MVFHREHNTHMLCEMEKFTNIWPRRPQQDFIMPPNIRLHRYPQWPNSCKVFCQTSSVLTYRNCTVCQTMFMMLYAGHFITDNFCNNLSPIYPNLWMCVVRDSGLFIFLTQVLIWSYSFAVHSQLYWTWIQDKESHTHRHTLLSNILFSIPPVPYSLPDHSVQVLVLHMTCQTHSGSKLTASLSAATYSSSRFSCTMFWSASVTKDCKQSQSSFGWKEVPVSRALLYISFRVSSKKAPLQVPLTELPQREMLHFWNPPSNISQSYQEMDSLPGSQTDRQTPISRALFYTSPNNSPVLQSPQ